MIEGYGVKGVRCKVNAKQKSHIAKHKIKHFTIKLVFTPDFLLCLLNTPNGHESIPPSSEIIFYHESTKY